MKLIKLFSLLLVGFSLCLVSCGDCDDKNWYEDKDGDGFGAGAIVETTCDNPGGLVSNNDDYDDDNANINRVWQGATTTFTKSNGADWTLVENQDALTSNVILTRQDKRGLFNIVTEEEQVGIYSETLSPADTEWARGTIANGIDNLTFDRFVGTLGNNVGDFILDGPLVLHLISDNIYIDVTFTSWSMNDSGGGFSYERSTEN